MPETAVTGTQVYLLFAVNLIAIIAGVGKGLQVLISVRDELRDMRMALGRNGPPATGLIGLVGTMMHEVQMHRDTLIEVTAELGLRRPGGRS